MLSRLWRRRTSKLCTACEKADIQRSLLDLSDGGHAPWQVSIPADPQSIECVLCKLAWETVQGRYQPTSSLVHLGLHIVHGGFLHGPPASRPADPEQFQNSYVIQVQQVSAERVEESYERSSPVFPLPADYEEEGIKAYIHVLDDNNTNSYPSRRLLKHHTTPLQFSPQTYHNWMSFCESNHEQCRAVAHNNANGNLPDGFRAIDLESQCITTGGLESDYIALSYVWGRVRQMRLCKGNIEDLTTPGNLDERHPDLSRTVREAMRLCRALGGRYLWIDALCIVQDDSSDKKSQIQRMDQIYQNATLTIACAAGQDANAGFPGVDGHRRPDVQRFAQLGSLKLGTCLMNESEKSTVRCWESRGWTYQERVLSDRILLFSPFQAYFICRQGAWCEDMIPEHPKMENACEGTSLYVLTDNISDLLNELLDPHRGRLNDLDRYKRHLEAYTRRTLSYAEDALNAFSGIMSSFGDSMDGMPNAFHWGLSSAYFEYALGWQWNNPDRTNHTNHIIAPARTNFPSWTWASREGTFTIKGNVLQLPEPIAIISFHTCTGQVINKIGLERDCKLQQEKPPPWKPLGARNLPEEFTQTQSPHSSHLLRFWTSSAFMKVQRESDLAGYKAGNPRDDDFSSYTFVDFIANPEPLEQDGGVLEFVVIGRCMHFPHYPLLVALCIVWEKDIAYRIGSAYFGIPESTWMELAPAWKYIVLG